MQKGDEREAVLRMSAGLWKAMNTSTVLRDALGSLDPPDKATSYWSQSAAESQARSYANVVHMKHVCITPREDARISGSIQEAVR